MGSGVHTWEEHVLHVFGLLFPVYDEVTVGLVGAVFLPALVDGRTLRHLHIAVVIGGILRVVGLTVEQRAVAILVAAQVVAQGEDVLGRVLVHRRVGGRANHNHGIGGVADEEHEHTQRHRVLHTGGDEQHAIALDAQHKPQGDED